MLLRRSRNRPGAARIRSWFVLLVGFGGLLALLVAASANALVSLDRLRAREAATRHVFLARNGDLEQIRAAIYLSGTYIRDYLLAPEPRAAELQHRLIESLRADTTLCLKIIPQPLTHFLHGTGGNRDCSFTARQTPVA